MWFERIDLQIELENLRSKEIHADKLLNEVEKILRREEEHEKAILSRLKEGEPSGPGGNQFDFDLLETNRIFHISQIKTLCVTYRLRFLSTKFFKGDLPAEALFAAKEIEKKHETTLKGFEIIAPARYFRLENADDPMLFAPIGNGYYYLVHKWGKDIHPLRKICMWPLKNLETLIIFSFFTSFFLTFGIRETFFSRFQETSQFLILFLYTFKSILALIFFYGISLGKNFSSGNWNSRFYNA